MALVADAVPMATRALDTGEERRPRRRGPRTPHGEHWGRCLKQALGNSGAWKEEGKCQDFSFNFLGLYYISPKNLGLYSLI